MYELLSTHDERFLEKIEIDPNNTSDYHIIYCLRHDWPVDRDEDLKPQISVFVNSMRGRQNIYGTV